MKRIISGCVVVLALVVLIWGGYADAKGFPVKPITYIICFNPGGESDVTARIQEKHLEKALGHDVVITYKVGGGGSVGWSEMLRSRPDGYTIAGHNLPHIVLQPLERGTAGYKTEDFKHITIFQSTPNLLVVRQDSPFKTLKDLINYAKKNPPGVVTIGGSGSSTANDLGVAMLNKAAGINLTYIPFGGTGSAVPALLGGHVTALMTFSPQGIQYKDKFRPLAIMSEERMSILPDVPTFRELGFDLIEGSYRGVAAPPGTPDDVIKVLAAAFDRVMREPEVKKLMDENGFRIENYGPEATLALVRKRMEEYRIIMKELGRLK